MFYLGIGMSARGLHTNNLENSGNSGSKCLKPLGQTWSWAKQDLYNNIWIQKDGDYWSDTVC